jgi:hypothetical protein
MMSFLSWQGVKALGGRRSTAASQKDTHARIGQEKSLLPQQFKLFLK